MSSSRAFLRTAVLGACSALLLGACTGGDQATGPSWGVNPPTAPIANRNAYDIQLRFVGDGITPRLREAFTRAVTRWSQVIVGDAGSTALSAKAGECQPWMPAVNETVNDLVVFVRSTRIDGPNGIVAQASPCYVNAESKLPIVGYLEVDSEDLDALVNRTVLDDVVLHEMGHVLGLGTLWNYKRSLLVGAGSDDPYFTGSGARSAFLAAGGNLYSGNPVPVENTGNQGTRDAHWRGSLFGTELMQGVVQAGGMPLSSITIGSLADLGYTVSLAAADPFSMRPTLRADAGIQPDDARTSLENDVAHAPLFEVDRLGVPRRIAPR